MIEFLASNVYARSASLLAIFLLATFAAVTASRWLARYAEVRAGLRDLEGSRAVVSLGRLRKQNENAWSRLADQIEGRTEIFPTPRAMNFVRSLLLRVSNRRLHRAYLHSPRSS